MTIYSVHQLNIYKINKEMKCLCVCRVWFSVRHPHHAHCSCSHYPQSMLLIDMLDLLETSPLHTPEQKDFHQILNIKVEQLM